MPQAAQNRSSNWTSTQAYVLVLICLLTGVVIGYLLRGSGPTQASAPAKQAPVQAQASQPGAMGAPVTPAQLKRMADKQAEPLLNELKIKPTDAALLAQVGNLYYDAQQFKEAIEYYARALESDPKKMDVRTDMATAFWYLGDPDRAIAEFDRVLQQQPTKASALLNRGIVRWQGKMDLKGAIADWETLLKADPNYPERPKVEQMIAQAKQHASIKPGQKTSKPAM